MADSQVGDSSERRWSLGELAGVLAPPCFLVALIGLSVASSSFLELSGWSAVHRSSIEWPSLLLLGPHGTLAAAAFLVTAMLEIPVALAVPRELPGRSGMLCAALLLIACSALSATALAPGGHTLGLDPSTTREVHNAAYLILVSSIVVAMVAMRSATRGMASWAAFRRVTSVSAFGIVASLALSSIDGVAQAARYPLLASLLVWIALLARTVHASRVAPG